MKKLSIFLLAALLPFAVFANSLHDIVTKDSTDRSVTVKIIDSTDGTPETGVVFNTAGIDLWYRREGAASVDITEATLAALTTAHTDGGFLAVNDGIYRLDLPDAAIATGANYVDFGGTVTGMIVIGGRIRLTDFTLETATQSVNVAQLSGDGTAADNAEAFFDGTGYAGTNNTIPTVTTLTGHTAQTGDSYARLGAPAGASIAADLLVIDNFVDDLESNIGTPIDFGSGTSTLAANLQDLADDGTAVYDRSTDSQQATRDRGDAAWTTGAGGSSPTEAEIYTYFTSSSREDLFKADVSALATAASIIALNDVSEAEVNAQVDAALADYDGPTNAEMVARTLVAANYFDPAADSVANVTLVATTTTNTDMRGTDSAATAANLATAQADLNILTGSDGATLATAQPNFSAGQAISTGLTAQAGSSTTITLASAESYGDNVLAGVGVEILSGTGAGQTNIILSNVGSTDVATVADTWVTNPSSDSVYQLSGRSVNTAMFNGAAVTTNLVTEASLVAAILAGEVEDQGVGYDLKCAMATLLAYAAGEVSTTTGVSTYQDPSGTESRIVGTVSGSTRDTITITCP